MRSEHSVLAAWLGLVGCTASAPEPTQPSTTPATEPVAKPEPPEREPEPTMRSLVASEDGGCVVRNGDGIWCWGGDLYGKLDVPLGIARRLELGEREPDVLAYGFDKVCALFVAPGSKGNLVQCVDEWSTQTLRVQGDQGLAVLGGQVCVTGIAGLECFGYRSSRRADLVDVTSSGGQGCGRTRKGELQCWRLYEGPDMASSHGVIGDAERIDMSRDQFCYLPSKRDVGDARQLRCADSMWGESFGMNREFVAIPGIVDVVDFDLDGAHGCALDKRGAVWCFGDNRFGQLGAGDTKHHDEPVEVPLPGPAFEVAVSDRKSCALLEQQVLCWGSDGGFLHDRRDRHRFELEADRLLVDETLSCARTPAGEWWCWGAPSGRGVADQLGGLLTSAKPRPAKLDPNLEEIIVGAVRVGDERREATISDELALVEQNVAARQSGILRITYDTVTTCTLRKAGKRLECRQEPPDLAWRSKITLADVDDFVVSDLDQFVCALRKGAVSCVTEERNWTKVPGLTSIVELALVQDQYVCGRARTGAVHCSEVALDGDYDGDERWTLPITDAVNIASGYALYGLLIRSARGTLELVDVADRKPAEQLIASGVVDLDVGIAHACVRLDEDGDGRSEAIECVGDNLYGRLGTLGDNVSLTPRAIEFPERFPIELPAIGTRRE